MKSLLGVLSRARYLWSRWASKGFWAVIDQALFAGTNFLVGVLLARWLDPASFGAFSTAYSVFLLVGTLHTALWTEPMLVYGSGKFAGRFGEYQRVLLRYHWRFSIISALVFMLIGSSVLIGGQKELGLGFLSLSFAAPLILFLWIARRGAYTISRPRIAALGGAVYIGMYLGGAYLLYKFEFLGLVSALLLMGLSAYIAGVLMIYMTRNFEPTHHDNYQVETGRIIQMHWKYGRWALIASGISWIPMNLYYIALPVARGLDSVASLKALMNLVLPILQLNTALAAILLPSLVTLRRKLDNMKAAALFSSGIFVLFAIVYYLVIYLYGNYIVKILYNNKYYYSNITYTYIGLIPVGFALINGSSAILRALEKPYLVAAAWAIASVLTIALLSYAVGGKDPVLSSVVAMVLVYFIGGAVMTLLALSNLQQGEE